MSEASTRTPEEVQASVARAQAEAAKAHAEAAYAQAEARKVGAEADIAELEFLDKARRDKAALAADLRNHVYRFRGEVGPAAVDSAIARLTEWSRLDPGCDIEVIFSSPGGSVIDGFELFDFLVGLRAQGHKLTCGVLGQAASMAGILVQAGDHRWVGAESWYLIHRAAFGSIGKTYENEDRVQWVKRIEKRIIDIFVSRSHLTAAKIRRNWDRKDWWLSSDECLEAGVVDEVRSHDAP